MKINSYNPYLKNSIWPILISINSLIFIINIIFITIKLNNYKILILNILILMFSISNWTFNIIIENLIIGLTSIINQIYTKIFISLIIISESIFFISFFYTNFTIRKFINSFFNFNLKNITNLNFILSFLNLIILLTSRITFIIFINLINIKKKNSLIYINLTIILGRYFVLIQFAEYKILNLNISNSIYYSNFFLLTFFHINHVIIGILTIVLLTYYFTKYLNSIKIKFIILCWYWHFIDLIWLIIFILIY